MLRSSSKFNYDMNSDLEQLMLWVRSTSKMERRENDKVDHFGDFFIVHPVYPFSWEKEAVTVSTNI